MTDANAQQDDGLLQFLYAAPVGLVQATLDGRIELINGAAAKLLLPITPDGRLADLFKVLRPLAPGLAAQVQAVQARQAVVCQGLRLAFQAPGTPGGVPRPVQWLSLDLSKLANQRLMAVLRDISAEVQNEQALRSSQHRLRFMLDAARIGDFEVDLASGRYRRSAQHDRCFGHRVPPADWRLETLLQQVHPDDRDRVRQQWQRALKQRRDWVLECRVLWPDGSLHWLRLQGCFAPDDPPPGRLLGLVTDISTQRLAEQARLDALRLQADNERMQAASQLKNQFLANMSHELRTPLNAVIGFADLLRAGAVPAGSPRHQAYLGHIGDSGRHLLQLINDVLDLAKVESGTFRFHPEPLHLPTVVQGVIDVLQHAAQARQLLITVQLDPAVHALTLDATRLKQVLYNYLSNAIKFTEPGGQVQLRAQPHGPLQVRIEVEDTGKGIPAADLPRLFTDFQQLDDGHARAHPGTGLGLSLTRKLVQAQGGSVGVSSQPGVGSVFHLVLNRVQGQGPDLADPTPPEGPGAPRVLVIDGDSLDQQQLARALALAGYQVDAASTGAQALDLACGRGYDAITLDLLMPDQPGLGVLSDIRHQGGSPQAPVVALTMPSSPGDSAHFAISNLLSKPIRTDEVAAAVQALRRATAQRTRVVVVDDEPQALALMEATLAALDIDVICHPGGREALQQLDADRPDAIVLDLLMPGCDGFEVLDALSRLPDWRNTPVLVWTSLVLSDAEYAQLGRSARAILGKGGGELAALLERLRRGLVANR